MKKEKINMKKEKNDMKKEKINMKKEENRTFAETTAIVSNEPHDPKRKSPLLPLRHGKSRPDKGRKGK